MKPYPSFTEKTVSSKKLIGGKFLQVFLDQVELPDKKAAKRFWINHPGAAAVAIFRKNRRDTFLVRQFRYALREETLEIPAGKLEEGETPKRGAIREVKEECSLQGKLKKGFFYYPALGYSNERIEIYLMENPVPLTKPVKGPEDEWIDGRWYTKKEVIMLYKNGKIGDSKTLLAFLFFGFLKPKELEPQFFHGKA